MAKSIQFTMEEWAQLKLKMAKDQELEKASVFFIPYFFTKFLDPFCLFSICFGFVRRFTRFLRVIEGEKAILPLLLLLPKAALNADCGGILFSSL